MRRAGLAVVALLALPAPAAHACPGPGWVGSWAASPSSASGGGQVTDLFGTSGDIKTPVRDSTVRAILTPTLGGSTVRVHLSNRFGRVPVTFAQTAIARRAQGAALIAGTSTPVTFAGRRSVTAAPGRDVVSDPVGFAYEAFQPLAVSVYVSGDAGRPTEHYTARQTSFLTPEGAGDRVGNADGGAFAAKTTTRPFVSRLEVTAPAATGAVVALGDSMTDGYQGQPPGGVPETAEGIDADGRWPDVLGRRLRAAGVPLSVLNAGISGNRVLPTGPADGEGSHVYGPSALRRLDGDVLAQAGATTVILLHGINDLAEPPIASVEALLAGYRSLIDRVHRAGLRVAQGTLTPAGGALNGGYGTAETEERRQAVNAWIRSASPADAVVDFDAAVRDPSAPWRIHPAYDGGDHLHLNLAGYRAMGNAVPLSALARAAPRRTLVLRVPRVYRRSTRRAEVLLGARRLARTRLRTIRLTLPAAPGALAMRLRLHLRGGRVVTLRRTYAGCG